MSRQRFESGMNPGSLSADPTTNIKAGDMYYNTTTGKHKTYNGTTWSEVGSGSGSGGKNYLTSYNGNTGNGDFELSNTTGWSLFNTTITNNLPTTITAGASSITTFDTVTGGSQLAKTFSLQTASSTSLTAGHGFLSDAFTIDTEDQAKAWSFAFSYKLASGGITANFSGTSANTYAVFIYDVTNTSWIQPAGVYNLVQKSGVGMSTGTFQTSATGTQYRIAVICFNAYASSITMYWDSFSIGPNSKVQGAAISDWVACTPTSNFTNTTTTGFVRRVGDSAEFIIAANCTGTPGAANLTFTLPSGFVIDTNKIAFGANNSFANSSGVIRDSGSGSYNAFPYYASSTTIQVRVANASGTYGILDSATATVPFAFATGDSAQVHFMVPIVGWSSNAVMSQDTDTRIVDFTLAGNPNNTITGSFSKMTWAATPVNKDTHSGWDQTNSEYIIPVSGDYFVSMQTEIGGTEATDNSIGLQVFNATTSSSLGVFYTRVMNSTLSSTTINGSKLLINLTAGTRLQFRSISDITAPVYSASVQGTSVSLMRLTGPSVIAASETVGLICNPQTATGTITSSPSVAKLGTVSRDTHGMYNTTTGLATIPVSGWYHLDGKVDISTSGIASGQYYAASFIVNGSSGFENFFVVGGTTPASGTAHTSITRYLNAGDTVGLGARSSATSPVYSSGLSGSFLSIVKAGM